MLATLEHNRNSIENDIATLVYYMQGGLSYETAWQIDNNSRRIMSKVVERHYEKMSGKSRLI